MVPRIDERRTLVRIARTMRTPERYEFRVEEFGPLYYDALVLSRV